MASSRKTARHGQPLEYGHLPCTTVSDAAPDKEPAGHTSSADRGREDTCPRSVLKTATTTHVVEGDSAAQKMGLGVVETATEISSPDAVTDSPQDRQQRHPPPPPEEIPAWLDVRLNKNNELGFCVFALRPFKRGERVFREKTALEATHDNEEGGTRNAYEQYQHKSSSRKQLMHGAFPELAWANGVDETEAADARTYIGSNVTTKGFALKISLTADDHIKMRPNHRGKSGSRRQASYHGHSLLNHSHGHLPSGKVTAASGVTAKAANKTRAVITDAFRSLAIGKKRRLNSSSNTGADDDDIEDDRKSTYSHTSRTASIASGMSGFSRGSQASAMSNLTQSSAGTQSSHGSKRSCPAPGSKDAKLATVDWFQRYGFSLPEDAAFCVTRGHHQAAVYLLTNLINHRCAGYQNCKVLPHVGNIDVVAEKDIAVGEELTINYRKGNKDFKCLGECCLKRP